MPERSLVEHRRLLRRVRRADRAPPVPPARHGRRGAARGRVVVVARSAAAAAAGGAAAALPELRRGEPPRRVVLREVRLRLHDRSGSRAAVTPRRAAATPAEWVAELWIDPDWFAAQEAEGTCATSGPPTVIPLPGTNALIGRASKSRNLCAADRLLGRRIGLAPPRRADARSRPLVRRRPRFDERHLRRHRRRPAPDDADHSARTPRARRRRTRSTSARGAGSWCAARPTTKRAPRLVRKDCPANGPDVSPSHWST